jgi:hypothetical protein
LVPFVTSAALAIGHPSPNIGRDWERMRAIEPGPPCGVALTLSQMFQAESDPAMVAGGHGGDLVRSDV